MLGGDEAGDERLGGRPLECARDADEEEDDVERRHAGRPDRGDREQEEHAHRQREARHGDDAAAIEAVSDVAPGERERELRDELHEADVPEVDCPVRHRVDLPPDRDRQHLRGQVREEDEVT